MVNHVPLLFPVGSLTKEKKTGGAPANRVYPQGRGTHYELLSLQCRTWHLAERSPTDETLGSIVPDIVGCFLPFILCIS